MVHWLARELQWKFRSYIHIIHIHCRPVAGIGLIGMFIINYPYNRLRLLSCVWCVIYEYPAIRNLSRLKCYNTNFDAVTQFSCEGIPSERVEIKRHTWKWSLEHQQLIRLTHSKSKTIISVVKGIVYKPQYLIKFMKYKTLNCVHLQAF